jgi:hypothetical protein
VRIFVLEKGTYALRSLFVVTYEQLYARCMRGGTFIQQRAKHAVEKPPFLVATLVADGVGIVYSW